MILQIFAIYDEKAGAYIAPFSLPTEGMAIRTFKNCVGDGEHEFGKNPQDFTLFRIAAFDSITGEITPIKEMMMNGVEIQAASTVEDIREAFTVPEEQKNA